MTPIIWERPDGMWSSALIREEHDDDVGFTFFASDFHNEQDAIHSLRQFGVNGTVDHTYSQDNIEPVRSWIIQHADMSPDPLTPDEVEDGLRYGEHEVRRMNSDEVTLIRMLVENNDHYINRLDEDDLKGYIPDSYLGKTLRLLSNKGLVGTSDNGSIQFSVATYTIYDLLLEQAEASMGAVTRMHLLSAVLQDEQNAGNFPIFEEYVASAEPPNDDTRMKLLETMEELSPLSDAEIAERHIEDICRWMNDPYAWRLLVPSVDGAINVIRLEGRTVLIWPETLQYMNQAGKPTTFSLTPIDLHDHDTMKKHLRTVLRTNRKIITDSLDDVSQRGG